MTSKKIKKNPYQQLIEHLYFAEGLEDLRAIGLLKRRYLMEWSKTRGEKLCQVFFALACGEKPEKILKALTSPPRHPHH